MAVLGLPQPHPPAPEKDQLELRATWAARAKEMRLLEHPPCQDPGTLSTGVCPLLSQPFPRLPAIKVKSLPFTPRCPSSEPQEPGSAPLLYQPRAVRAQSADNDSSRPGAGKAAPWQTQALRQAELSILPPSLKRLIKDKKKQTKEKRELMDMS